jgi:hypothetical protein
MSIAWEIANPSFTVKEFCSAERMSRSKLYEAWREGNGPRFYWVGNHRRITAQARLDWQRQQEAKAAALTNIGTTDAA